MHARATVGWVRWRSRCRILNVLCCAQVVALYGKSRLRVAQWSSSVKSCGLVLVPRASGLLLYLVQSIYNVSDASESPDSALTHLCNLVSPLPSTDFSRLHFGLSLKERRVRVVLLHHPSCLVPHHICHRLCHFRALDRS